jgi:hypothetical protein
MNPQPPIAPPLDVMAVLADLQQQLTDLTGVVQAQQRTLQRLLGDGELATAPAGAGVVRPDVRRP